MSLIVRHEGAARVSGVWRKASLPTPRERDNAAPPSACIWFGLRTGAEGLIPASSGPKVLTSELACFSILVAFPGLHKPSHVSDFSIKVAGLYAHLPTLPPRRPTFLPGEGSWPALLSPVGGTQLHGSLGPGHSAVGSTPWPWGPPCGPGSRGHREEKWKSWKSH